MRPLVLWNASRSSGPPMTMAGMMAWVRRVRAGACGGEEGSHGGFEEGLTDLLLFIEFTHDLTQLKVRAHNPITSLVHSV